MIDRVKPAYVFVGGGSGVCVDPEGWILTNHHVAGGARNWKVRFAGGRRFDAELVGWHPADDVALLKVRDGKELPFCELGDSDRVRVGDPVIAVGNPFLLGNGSWEPTITHGIVSALHVFLDNPGYKDAIQTDAQINPGNSGGPLLSMEGKVIGINGRIDIRRFMNRVNTGIGYAIPSNQIARFLPEFKAGGRAYGAFLEQATIGDAGDPRYEHVGEYGDGVFVAGVTAGTPAAAAGLEPGDLIVDIEGQRPFNRYRFHGIVGARPAGSVVRLKVKRRDGATGEWKERELRVLLGDTELLRAPLDALEVGFRLALEPAPNGLRIESVLPEEPGAKAGVRAGDILRTVGGKPVPDRLAFKAAFREVDPTDRVTLTVMRDGKELPLELVPVAGRNPERLRPEAPEEK